jgi:hypothetical protein
MCALFQYNHQDGIVRNIATHVCGEPNSGVVNEIVGSYTRGERINLLLCILLEVVTNGLKTRNMRR